MNLFEKIKSMTIEEMAESRVKLNSKHVGRSNADNWDFYDYWYETSDGKTFSENDRKSALKHEVELLKLKV